MAIYWEAIGAMATKMDEIHAALRRLNARLPGFTVDGAYGGWQLQRGFTNWQGGLSTRTSARCLPESTRCATGSTR